MLICLLNDGSITMLKPHFAEILSILNLSKIYLMLLKKTYSHYNVDYHQASQLYLDRIIGVVLRDLVPFVQLKNVKNTHGGVLKVKLLHGCFSRFFKLYK